MARKEPVPGDILLHPVALSGAVLLAVNDFILKPYFSGWISGKLSDVAINLVLPMVLTAAWEWTMFFVSRVRKREWRPAGPVVGIVVCIISGAYFSALQLSPAFIAFHLRMVSFVFPIVNHGVTPDLTDLFTLVLLVPAWFVIKHRARANRMRSSE